MLKYIFFALLVIIIMTNFLVKPLWKLVFKRDITDTCELAVKLVCFVAAPVLAAIIFFVA